VSILAFERYLNSIRGKQLTNSTRGYIGDAPSGVTRGECRLHANTLLPGEDPTRVDLYRLEIDIRAVRGSRRDSARAFHVFPSSFTAIWHEDGDSPHVSSENSIV
jgi:hypothetical protein